MKTGKPLLAAMEYQGNHLVLEVYGPYCTITVLRRLLCDLRPPFKSWEPYKAIIIAVTHLSELAQDHRLEVKITISG
jgi:hypothetical protein